jgi:glycosyltransferase involved in cell wall biosynthesis
MAIKVFYVLSDIDKAMAFEWIVDFIDKKKIDLRFLVIGKKDSALQSFLKERKIIFYTLPRGKKMEMIGTWFKVFFILRKEKPDVVHTHLYYANLIGLPVAWILRIPKRIHTRHHASLHHAYFKNAVYIDKMLNWVSTDIVVLSVASRKIVTDWEKTPERKVHLVPHGFNLDYFSNVHHSRIQSLRERYQIPTTAHPVIGVISRFTEWKGLQFIIPAFAELLTQFQTAHLVLANARGDYSEPIQSLLNGLPENTYTLIEFENDSASLYQLFTVFVHTPVDEFSEAFGQTYVESLASGIPAVVTLSGIANDFMEDGENAIVVNYKDPQAISKGITRILLDPVLKNKIVAQGKAAVSARFSIQTMVRRLESLYAKAL